MATASYFNHFLDIIRSKTGRPLLEQLAASPGRIIELLTAPPIDNEKVSDLVYSRNYTAQSVSYCQFKRYYSQPFSLIMIMFCCCCK